MERMLSPAEISVITKIANMLSDNRRAQLLKDMANAKAQVESSQRTIFNIAGYKRPPDIGQHSFGVEGRLFDRDGVQLNLDLYADQNDRLLELELLRIGAGDVLAPKWETLELY
ncbi:MAG: hypothetical protein WBB98_12645 [Xanthobacteraceae bacterium]|jgi:hypothetical protein